MKYDRPVRELLAECADQLAQPFDRNEVFSWFRANYPDVAEGTISTHIAGLTAGSRPHALLASYPPVVERVGLGLYRRVQSSGVCLTVPSAGREGPAQAGHADG